MVLWLGFLAISLAACVQFPVCWLCQTPPDRTSYLALLQISMVVRFFRTNIRLFRSYPQWWYARKHETRSCAEVRILEKLTERVWREVGNIRSRMHWSKGFGESNLFQKVFDVRESLKNKRNAYGERLAMFVLECTDQKGSANQISSRQSLKSGKSS